MLVDSTSDVDTDNYNWYCDKDFIPFHILNLLSKLKICFLIFYRVCNSGIWIVNLGVFLKRQKMPKHLFLYLLKNYFFRLFFPIIIIMIVPPKLTYFSSYISSYRDNHNQWIGAIELLNLQIKIFIIFFNDF